MNCPECGRQHVMGCDECGADLDVRDHYETCPLHKNGPDPT